MIECDKCGSDFHSEAAFDLHQLPCGILQKLEKDDFSLVDLIVIERCMRVMGKAMCEKIDRMR